MRSPFFFFDLLEESVVLEVEESFDAVVVELPLAAAEPFVESEAWLSGAASFTCWFGGIGATLVSLEAAGMALVESPAGAAGAVAC